MSEEKEKTDLNDLPFGNDNGYDLNKITNQYMFPGRMWALIGNTEQEIPTQGITKREFFALQFARSLSAEYVKKPLPAIIEIINSQAIKMADDLLNQLNLPT